MNPTDHPQACLVATDLHKRFGDVVALDGASLHLDPGELLALVGPSGCGKSTLLRSIAGLVALDSGTIELGGRIVDDGRHRVPPERRSIGLVFQEHALFPHLTVADNVGFGIRGESSADTTRRIGEMLDLVSLHDHGDRFPHELSGGERQRVALARALAPAPDLMLLDEPFASLDHNLRVRLRHDVIQALAATDTPAVFVTHDQDEALMIGGRVAVMRDGRVRQVADPATIFHAPSDRFVAAFMGDASFLPVSESAGSLRSVLGQIDAPRPAASTFHAMVRPDDVSFSTTASGTAMVTTAEYHGSQWLLTVRHDSGAEVLVRASHLERYAVGDRGELMMVAGHRQTLVVDAEGADQPE